MKKNISAVLFFATLLTSCSEVKKSKPETVNRLNWLNGSWAMKTDDGTVTEQWKPVNDSLMEGSSDFVKGDSVIPFETIRIFKRDTSFYYEAKAAGQNNEQPVEFKLSSISDSGFVAENPQHDFPKRIVYKLKSTGVIHAYVDDGSDTGKRLDFIYKQQ